MAAPELRDVPSVSGGEHFVEPRIVRPLAGVLIVLTFAALFGLGCPPPTPPRPPTPHGACETRKLGSNVVREVHSQVSVDSTQFAFDQTSVVRERGKARGGERRMLLRRGSRVVLQVETQVGAKGDLRIHVQLGDGLRGSRELLFSSTDRGTLQGTIDGKQIVPLPLREKPDSVRFADGSEIPATIVDDDVKQALHLVEDAIEKQCPSAKPTSYNAPAPPPVPTADPPGHDTDPQHSEGCNECRSAVVAGEDVCLVAAAVASEACAWAFPICFLLGVATCDIAFYETMCNVCHDPSFSGCGGNGPCCPVACSDYTCCGQGEACIDTGSLCCSGGTTPCGNANCCVRGTETCMGDGTCCSVPCGSVCCGGVQPFCANSATSKCCTLAHRCDGNVMCCEQNEWCSNHRCTACDNCNGPNQECCFGRCCSGAQMFCDPDSKSCKCKPNCEGKCGGAPDGCGGACNAPCGGNQMCVNQTCCAPNCDGKCGGAPDGCGGKCLDCLEGQVCKNRACVSDCGTKVDWVQFPI